MWRRSFKFDIADDSILQDGPISFRVMDSDLYRDDPIGTVHIDLNPLLMRTEEKETLMIQGWFPIFDSLEVYV